MSKIYRKKKRNQFKKKKKLKELYLQLFSEKNASEVAVNFFATQAFLH